MSYQLIGTPKEKMAAMSTSYAYDLQLGDNIYWNDIIAKMVESYGWKQTGDIVHVSIKAEEFASSKDRAVVDLISQLSAEKCYGSDGSLKPISRPIIALGTKILPFSYFPEIEEVWASKSGQHGHSHLLNIASDSIPYTPIGLMMIEKGLDIYQLQKQLVSAAELISPDYGAFEKGELFRDHSGRGLFFSCMMHARLLLNNSSLFGTRVPAVKGYEPPTRTFRSLKSLDEVIVEKITANVGLYDLVSLAEAGSDVKQSPEYIKLKAEAEAVIPAMSSKPLNLNTLTSMIPPHAVGRRFQSNGRAIIMVAKILFFLMSLWGQPLTSMLEEQLWYASGDRTHRRDLAKALLDGKISYAVDGDDFVLILHIEGKRIVIAGDYSAYESSVRWVDHRLFMTWLKSHVISQCP